MQIGKSKPRAKAFREPDISITHLDGMKYSACSQNKSLPETPLAGAFQSKVVVFNHRVERIENVSPVIFVVGKLNPTLFSR
ncbi:MAG TPA: hypothetical protein VGG46_09690 [Terriglobales bacterium]|jgi:hypothetical protein